MSDIPHDGGLAISIQKIKAKISARAVAGQQFMIIVIGLGITAAIGKFAELFKNPSDVPSEDQVFILAVFLIYATRFFFNNWLYLSESYDPALLDDLQDIIKRRSIKTRYFMTILRCVNFDIGLAIFTGLACALTGTLVFIESVHTPVVVALVVHYLFDAAILAHNILSRWLERPAEYAFNLTRVVFWFGNNLLFAVLFAGFWIFAAHDEYNFMIIVYMWVLNSIIAIGITAVFALLEGKKLRPSLS